tara:strand:- start:127631 stop:129070 length:1440 start_codon:yes stop_codon:yes gene_type:complete
MKLILLTFLFSISSFALVKDAEKLYRSGLNSEKSKQISYELSRSRYYFSSSIFAKEFLVRRGSIDLEFEQHLENLILKTGTLTFSQLDEATLNRYNTPSLRFILGLKLFRKNQNVKTIRTLNKFPKNHRFSPEAFFTLGSSYAQLGKRQLSKNAYDTCIETSTTLEDQAENKKLKRYFAIIKETCLIHYARVLYKLNKFTEAKEIYQNIPKTSYRWPYLLLERAWNSYQKEDYNRSLGKLVTYKSPLLRSYFIPEAQYLTALSYYKLCLYDDSLSKIEQYYTVYRPQSETLKKFLLKNKSSNTYFLKLMLSPIKENEKLNPYIRNLMTQIRKKIKFNLDLINYKKIQNEYRHLAKMKGRSGLIKILTAEIKTTLSVRTTYLNHYVKKNMFDFVNEIHRFSFEMFNIKLEIMSNKRDLIYKNKALISDRSRGSWDHVKRDDSQHLYDFKGEFWADELGDYSFGLKSNCKTVKKKWEEKDV